MTFISATPGIPHSAGVRHPFSKPLAADGAQAGKAGIFSRSPQVGVEHAIRSASPATLLSSMKNAVIPEQLTSGQQEAIANLLDRFHPQTLSESPLIDAHGKPIPLHLASTPLTDAVTGKAIPVDKPLQRGLVQMLTHYRQHLNWERDNLSIRKVAPGDAASEPALIGQDGVFAARDIPLHTPVAMFGGMYLTDPADIRLDARIRDMSGVGAKKYHVAQEGGTLQGMGRSMKLNSGDDQRSNLFPVHLNVVDGSGQKMKVMALFSTRPIKAGEELRFNYKVEK